MRNPVMLSSPAQPGFPALADLDLDDWEAGFVNAVLDLGVPVTRPVSSARPGADGTDDHTGHVGARVVSWTGTVLGSTDGTRTRRDNLDALAPFCHPGRRSTLTFEDPAGGGQRFVHVRAETTSAPMAAPDSNAVALTWVGFTGIIESTTTQQATISPADDAPGWSPPLVPPLTFPGPLPAVGTQVVQAGTTAASFTARIYGPVTGPVLANVTTGELVAFPGLVVAAGDWLDLDFTERTALLNGTANRYGRLDFTTSTWWQLPPGESVVSLTGDDISPDAYADLTWRAAYLL